jgi:hypothetical protein
MNKFKALFVLVACTFSMFSHSVTVNNVKIERIYVQSINGASASEAHAISINKEIDSSCSNRLHIDPVDKTLFSTMLAYKLSGTEFHLMYVDAPAMLVQGHLSSGCKLISVY